MTRHPVRHVAWRRGGLDASLWIVALALAMELRTDVARASWNLSALSVLFVGCMLGQVVIGWAVGLYRQWWRYGSLEELGALAVTIVATGGLATIVNAAANAHFAPRSVPAAASFAELVLAGGLRWGFRMNELRRKRPDPQTAIPVIVFGAGDAGHEVLRSMRHDGQRTYHPVALLDDDPSKANHRILGVRVRGGLDQLGRVVAETGATTLAVAITSADGALIRRATDVAEEAGVDVRVLPSVVDLLGRVAVSDLRPVNEADLLGRRQIDLDHSLIHRHLTGRTVLVTGAGGSIGSELCRQIQVFSPARLIMLDRDESALQAVQFSVHGRCDLASPDLALVDIRDVGAVRDLFDRDRPDVVFHAAALKHVTMLETHPAEAVKTNVHGTINVLRAAVEFDTRCVVNISTDKAADPVNVLGYTKRLAERLTAHAASHADQRFVSVRFGNVLGSRGSMLGTFQAQIEQGGPLTVTDEHVTRYFMLTEEAVALTMQASTISESGQALVLDMGEPVRIMDVAKRMAAAADRPIRIEITGLRAGEKLHEVLLARGEPDDRPSHPMICQVRVPPLDWDMLPDELWSTDPTVIVEALRGLVERDLRFESA
jgi:FlaA1/EpsC-like NDP-sugar epimerase